MIREYLNFCFNKLYLKELMENPLHVHVVLENVDLKMMQIIEKKERNGNCSSDGKRFKYL